MSTLITVITVFPEYENYIVLSSFVTHDKSKSEVLFLVSVGGKPTKIFLNGKDADKLIFGFIPDFAQAEVCSRKNSLILTKINLMVEETTCLESQRTKVETPPTQSPNPTPAAQNPPARLPRRRPKNPNSP